MPPSERTQAATDQEDDILERKPSHPVTTTLLIVSAISLMVAIGITVHELERYVNRETRGQLDEYKKTAVRLHEETYGAAAVEDEGAPTGDKAPAKHRKVDKDATPDQPASEPAPPPEGKSPEAPAAPEGGSTGESTGG